MNVTRILILWLAFFAACFLPASALSPTAPENRIWEIFSTWYDAPVAEVTTGYDSLVRLTPRYDEAQIHGTGGETRSTKAERTLFGLSAEFKAAQGERPQWDVICRKRNSMP